MDTHPFESWDTASEIFTYADSPMAIQVMFWLSVLVTVGVIYASARHEKHAMNRIEQESGR